MKCPPSAGSSRSISSFPVFAFSRFQPIRAIFDRQLTPLLTPGEQRASRQRFRSAARNAAGWTFVRATIDLSYDRHSAASTLTAVR